MGLETRYKIEEDFHNNWARTIDLDDVLVVPFFESCTSVENKYALETFGEIKGKHILDLGCGAGEASVYFALKGAIVTAADISDEMLKVVEKVAEKYKVKVNTKKIIGEKMDISSESFDYVFGNGVLHHLDRNLALPEICRVLKKGGKAVFIEPLPYNSIINIYRKKAQSVRTKTETPIKFTEIKLMKKIFTEVSHKEFWFFALAIFIWFYIVEKADPSKIRYWKKIIKEAEKYKMSFYILNSIDRFILTVFPLLKRFCWNTVLVLEK